MFPFLSAKCPLYTSLVLFMSSVRPVHPGAFVTPGLLKVRLDGFQNGGSLQLFSSHRLLRLSVYLWLWTFIVP